MAKKHVPGTAETLGQLSESAMQVLGPDGIFATYLRSMDPQTIVRQSLEFYKAMGDIMLGKSTIAPDKRDWRFQDEAWNSNPFYKRLSQAYIAMTEAVEAMIPEDLPWDERARVDLAAQIVNSTFAPTNSLIGNPKAISRTIETGGSNLVKGFKAFLDDMVNNHGLPRQVDSSGFEVGKNMAVTPGKVVLRTEMFELIQYTPATETVSPVPVILVPPQIARYYFSDLTPGRSFAEFVVSQGLQYFAISWRNPTPDENHFGMENYVDAVIEAIEAACAITGAPKANVIGFCAGGITAAITAAYLEAQGRDLFNTFTPCVAMFDFDNDASLGAFRLPTMLTVAKAQSALKGVLPGSEMHKIFAWLRPNDLIWNYWVNNYLMGDEPAPFDILAWDNDSTNMAARLHQDFLDLFDGNALAEPGAYRVKGVPVSIGDVACDKFIVAAVTDHLTPWKCCYKSQTLLTGNRTFALSNGGHVAALVNPPGNPKAYHWIGAADQVTGEEWQQVAEKRGGSWWESWTAWCAERSGDRAPAPKAAGSKKFPAIMDAPGDYVRQ